MITLAGDEDMPLVRKMLFEDSATWPVAESMRRAMGWPLYAAAYSTLCDDAIRRSQVYVARDAGAPVDTVCAFMIADLRRGQEATIQWLASKRAWRGTGFVKELLGLLDGKSVSFTRYATDAQRIGLEARGWVYAPHLAMGENHVEHRKAA